METTVGARTWREHDADALEVRAEAIEHATISLENLDGMFDDRREIRDSVIATLGLLKTEVENLRTAATRLRAGRAGLRKETDVVDLAARGKKRARS